MIITDTEGIFRHMKRYRRIIPYLGRGIRNNACFGVILKYKSVRYILSYSL